MSDSIVFDAFQKGFSDYMIKMEIDLEFFVEHFFGPEGNERSLSFVAFKDDLPVGVILGGFRTDEAFKTLRCGAMSIVPEERGSGLADQLIRAHEKAAREAGCRQLSLEVIKGNDRAIRFYEKNGYEKTYDMIYRIFRPSETFKWDSAIEVVESSFDEFMKLRRTDQARVQVEGLCECPDRFSD